MSINFEKEKPLTYRKEYITIYLICRIGKSHSLTIRRKAMEEMSAAVMFLDYRAQALSAFVLDDGDCFLGNLMRALPPSCIIIPILNGSEHGELELAAEKYIAETDACPVISDDPRGFAWGVGDRIQQSCRRLS